ncbi:MAG: helix-turn-helix domain-containing protein [Hyphomonadaceae bacterium JAD_PAG50586_4]|nr:MAG: helix-turn-helix domain-containing protein [Hyphomonadaceae bacterium JAD_PAG50586_4]
MSKTSTIVKMDKSGVLRRKGVVVKVPRGRALDDAEALAATKTHPDNPPLTKKRMASMVRTPQVKVLRRALGLTQQEFAARYQIPLGTLRDWEQGRATPDLPTRAYLKVIARDPKAVEKALERG